MLEKCKVEQLSPGMVIVKITQQQGPVKIKKSGLVTSSDMVDGLKEMGVLEVEIDTSQTVELEESEPQSIDKTHTQALMSGDYDVRGQFDNQLSDQFNRSLFLPSVQGMKPLWSLYVRPTSQILLSVVIGFCIGFAGATYPTWWRDEPLEVTQVEEQQKETNTVETQDPPSTEIPEVILEEQEQPEPVIEDEQIALEVQNQTPQAQVEEPQISPELLRRFNQAIEEIDNQPRDLNDEPQVAIRNDIKRIDQLPVRLMTSLPSMTFSAHMYATRESDRWVRVNGLRLQEGDWIDDTVQIVSIEAQRVVLTYQGEVFSMAALTDW